MCGVRLFSDDVVWNRLFSELWVFLSLSRMTFEGFGVLLACSWQCEQVLSNCSCQRCSLGVFGDVVQ